MSPIVFELPWPPSVLMPNAKRRQHWRDQAKHTKRHREACRIMTLAQKVRLPEHEGRFLIEFQFGPPDLRKRDRLNLLGAMKGGIDGVADALGIDDERFDPGEPQMGAVTKGGIVWVRITPREAKP